jgi:hypothetical protein
MVAKLATLILIYIAYSSNAQEFLSVGFRGGMSYNSNNHCFLQAETFIDLDLPWACNFYSDWRFQPKCDVSGGWLGGEHSDGFVGTLGPIVELSKGKCPLTFECGSSPTFLSKYQFGDENFGGKFQFTSHIGLNWHLTKHISIGYRFQHMSNAGLWNPNPGLNLNMFSFTFRF